MKLQIGLILRPEQLFKKWLDIPILCNIWDEKRLMNFSRAIHWSQTSYFWRVFIYVSFSRLFLLNYNYLFHFYTENEHFFSIEFQCISKYANCAKRKVPFLPTDRQNSQPHHFMKRGTARRKFVIFNVLLSGGTTGCLLCSEYCLWL